MAEVQGKEGFLRRRIDQELSHRRTAGHLRVVRLLPLRHARGVLRGRCSSRRATRPRRCSRASPPSAPASACARSARSSSAASATWSGASTPSWSRSSMGARPRSSACCPPTSARLAAPILLVTLAPAAGPALGGEYGGAATYVAEHAPTTARLLHELHPDHGDARLLPVAAGDRRAASTWTPSLRRLGLAHPVPGVAGPAGVLGLHPAQDERVAALPEAEGGGQVSKNPLTESFGKPNNKYVLLALFGATAGRASSGTRGSSTPCSSSRSRSSSTSHRLHADRRVAAHRDAVLHLLRLAVGPDRPAQDHHGRLPDRRGDLLPAVRRAHALRQSGARGVLAEDPISVAADQSTCKFHIFVGPWTKFSELRPGPGLPHQAGPVVQVVPPRRARRSSTTIGSAKVEGWDDASRRDAEDRGLPLAADKSKVNWVMAELILVIMVIYVTMVYGPIAAFLVELFPTKIRYTSMSLPYHIGNGWFGGMLPLPQMVKGYLLGLWYHVVHVAGHRQHLPQRDAAPRHPYLPAHESLGLGHAMQSPPARRAFFLAV